MSHLASLTQLQTPAWAVSNGELVSYGELAIPITAEALTRALSVFEGVKGYWDDDVSTFAIRTLDRHYRRLSASARAFAIPMPVTFDEYVAQCHLLADALLVPEKDLWMRTTLYVVEGHWGEGTRADLVITGFHQPKAEPTPVGLTLSSWRRPADDMLPTRVKSGANYVTARLARIEAHQRGFDDAIMLNQHGRIAEATGACVVALKDGRIVSPSAWEGALDSITTSIVAELARARGISFEQRPLDRTELLASDEVAICGTITELTPVSAIDTYEYPVDGVLAELNRDYLAAMRSRRDVAGLSFSTVTRTRA